MKSLRNKVILSGIVLVFAFIATIGSTYAWFTVSSQTTVESINLTVASQDNLLIMVDDGYTSASSEVNTIDNYSTSLLVTDITSTTQYANLANFRILPVTALNSAYSEVDGKNLGLLESLADYDRSLTAAVGNNDTTGHYIELKFWLYSQSDVVKNIALGDNVAIETTETDPELDDIIEATRIAVWSGETGSETDAYIFGNDIDFGFSFDLGEEGYSATAAATPTNSDFNDLLNRTTALVDGVNYNLLSSVTGYDRVIDLDDEVASPTTLFTIASTTPTLVTVRIFVEGWDSQTRNTIVAANYSIALGFKFND